MFYFIRHFPHFILLCSANLFAFLLGLFSMSSFSEESSLSDAQSESTTDRSVSTCDDFGECVDKSDGKQKSIVTYQKSLSTTENISHLETIEDDLTDDYTLLDDLLKDMNVKDKELADEDTTLTDYTYEDDFKKTLDMREFDDSTSTEEYTSLKSNTSSQSSQGLGASTDSFYSDGSKLWAMPSPIPRTNSVTSLSITEYEFEVTAFTEDEDGKANDVDKEKLSEADEPRVISAMFSVSLKQAIEDSMKSIEIDFTSDLGILGVVVQELKNSDEDIEARSELDADKMFRADCSQVSLADDLTVSGWFHDEKYSLQDFDTGSEEKREEDPDLYDHKEAGHEFPEDVKPLKPRMSLLPMPPLYPPQFYPTGGLMYPPNYYPLSYPGGNCTWTSQVPHCGVAPFIAKPSQFDFIRPQMGFHIRPYQHYPSPGYSNVQYSGQHGNNNGAANFGNRGNQYNLRPNNAAYQNRANYGGARSYDRPNQQQQDYPRQFNSNQGQRTGNYDTTNSRNQSFSHEGFNPNRAASTNDTRPQGSPQANQWMAKESTSVPSVSVDARKGFPILQANSNQSEQLNLSLAASSGSKLVARSGQQQDWYDFKDLSTLSSRPSNSNDRSTGYSSYGTRENVRNEGYDYGYGPRNGSGNANFTGQRPTRHQDVQQQRVETRQVAPSIAPTSGTIPNWSSIGNNRP